MSQKKGNFVIKGAAGTAKLAGLATLTNDNPSASVRDDSPIDFHKDSDGIIRSVTRDQVIDTITLRLTPGIGSGLASLAATIAAIASVRKGDLIITGGFDIDFLNFVTLQRAMITDISYTQAEGALGELNVTASRYFTSAGYSTDGSTTIDFTTAAFTDI